MPTTARKQQIIRMLENEPNDVFLNYALAMEYLGSSDLINAEKQFTKTLNLDANYLPCFYQLGQLNEQLGQNEKAISYYQQGVVLAKSQNNTKALGELNEAIWMLED